MGWVLCTFYSLILKNALWIYITHFLYHKDIKRFSNGVWHVLWRKGRVNYQLYINIISIKQLELGRSFGQTEMDRGEWKVVPPTVFMPCLPLRPRCHRDGISAVKVRHLFSRPKCNDNQGQKESFANRRRRSEAKKDKAFGYIQQSPHLLSLPHFIHFLNPNKLQKLLQIGRIFNHYHVPGKCKGIPQQTGCFFL